MPEESEYRQLILDNLRLVRIIALKIRSRLPAGIELGDLIHTGILGLIDAIKRFDPGKGTKFATYASLRIRGAILDELRNLDWASRSLRHKIKDIEAAFGTLEMELGRPPTEEEVARSLKMDIREFHRLLDDAKGLGSGVYRYSDPNQQEIGDEMTIGHFEDEGASSPDLVIEKAEMKRLLAGFVETLPEREKLVLSLYYNDDLNLREIAGTLDLTESRISQIRTAAILRLRAKISGLARLHQVRDRDVL
jgi:RNA polymerase sigma factor FliA